MEHRLTPEAFCGAAIAALTGLIFGLMLHIPWEKHPGGPQILFGAAQAAEAHPDPGDSLKAVAATDRDELAELDAGYLPPDPLPVVRLRPEMFDVQPAAAEGAERAGVDDLIADAPPPDPPRDLD